MANGGYWHTKADWQRAEAPLRRLDPVLDAFAGQHRLRITRNLKDWPERSIAWGDSIRLLIQVYLTDPQHLTFNVWLCASHDRGDQRYWKHEMPVRGLPVEAFENDFASLLREAKAKLESWSEADFEFATPLARKPDAG